MTAERSNRIAQAAIASATAAWANLFGRCAAIHASTSELNIGSAAKMSKLQERTSSPVIGVWTFFSGRRRDVTKA